MNDSISRQEAIDAMLALQAEDEEAYGCRIPEGFDGDRAVEALKALPPAQPEITLEDIKEYCKKRYLVVMPGEYYNNLIGKWSGIAPERKEESNEC